MTSNYQQGHNTGYGLARSEVRCRYEEIVREEVRAYQHLLDGGEIEISERSELSSIVNALNDLLKRFEVER